MSSSSATGLDSPRSSVKGRSPDSSVNASEPSIVSSGSSTLAARAAAASRTSPKTKYLIAYNAISAGLWLAILNRVVTTTITQRRSDALYDSTGEFARWTQTVALLEILHAAFGIVRAPLFTTFLQVASRVIVIWGIVESFPVGHEWAYTTMLFAWSLTEVVRYSYFVLSLTGQVPPAVIWLRYNLFFVLYPLGISSEMFEVYKSIPHAMKKNPLIAYVLYGVLGIYFPGAYILYTHMMAQRRRVLRGKQRARD